MTINVVGLVVLLLFYIVILVVGIVAARRKKKSTSMTAMESSIVAGRDISTAVGIFTMTATTVGGGYINGTAESIATSGLVWTLAPFGIFIGLIVGGLVFAKKMRDQNYLTMLDPFQEVYGNTLVFMVYLASLCGDIFWTASILSALGTSLSVIVNIPLTVAIVTSSAVTIIYTMIGQMVSVAYTDIVQLIFITFGLVLSLPFILTNENVGDICQASETWIGTFDISFAGQWWDLFVAMTLGTIPWQAYFQRVLSVRSGRQAQILSVVGACSAVILVIPSVIIGAVATNADWNKTSLGQSPMELNMGSMVLPLVLQNFTPNVVAVIGLGAISAAVMSSMDSSILGSSSMFTYNIYAHLFRTKASDSELLWIQRLAILFVGSLATVISIFVPIVYGLFILAADIVFVIVLPQLICAVYFKWTNSYGAIVGYLVGVTLRVGAGEPTISLPAFIYYPDYDGDSGQNFPFRTFAMVTSLLCIVIVSIVTTYIEKNVMSKTEYKLADANVSRTSSKQLLQLQAMDIAS
ncbi:high-affinity choline transporter 1-like [Mytilus edulis]|uniref:high-affinity choline transporter 1-like n=1 Tax=Mytilus edulis TaxID=6550 RepID=UPI0039F04F5F